MKSQVSAKNGSAISESLLAKVALYTDGLIIISDQHDRIVWVNESLMKRTGYQLHELKGKRPGNIFRGAATDPDTAKAIDRAYRRNKEYECEILNYTKGGEPFWIHLTMNPIEGSDYFISVGKDITDKKEKQRRIKQAQLEAEKKAREKQDIISVLSHDMKSPLTSMLGSIDLLKGNNLKKEQVQVLDMMELASNNMLRLVNNMLEMSKIESDSLSITPKDCNLKTLFDDVTGPLTLQAQTVGTIIHRECDEELDKEILIDPVRFSQIINNIVSNGIKFTDQGTIDIILRSLSQENNHIAVQLEIHDDGCGIAGDEQKKIFKKFEQADHSNKSKYTGTGLGLAITQHIVNKMGGRIWLESTHNEGTSVYVKLTLKVS